MTLTNNGTTTTSAVIWGTDARHRRPDDEQHDQEPEPLRATRPRPRSPGVGFGSSTISAATLGTRNNNNRVQNNSITTVQFGVVSQGAQSAAKNAGTVITGNTLGGNGAAALGRAGVYVGFDDGVQVTNNTVVNVFCEQQRRRLRHRARQHLDRRHRRSRRTTTWPTPPSPATSSAPSLKTDTFSAAGISLGTPNYGTSRIANNSVYGVVMPTAPPGDFAVGIYVGSAGTTVRDDRRSTSTRSR